MTSPSPVQPPQSAFAPQPAVAPQPTAFPGLPPQTVVTSPVAPPAPTAAAPTPSPAAEPQPAAPEQPVVQTPPIDPVQHQLFAQKAAERDQIVRELQQLERQRQQQAEEQRVTDDLARRREMIYQTAKNLPPEEMETYIRNQENLVVADLIGRVQQTRQQMAAEAQQMLMQVSAPLYAQHLAQQHQLLPEFAQQLAAFPPQQIDQMVPIILNAQRQELARRAEVDQLRAQIEQFQRSQGAQAQVETGVHELSGAGGSPVVAPGEGQYQPGSIDHLLATPGLLELLTR